MIGSRFGTSHQKFLWGVFYMHEYNIQLDVKEMPDAWYNIAADLSEPMDPPLHPATHQPLAPDDLAAIFPPSLVEQEMSTERWISIPGEVMDIYRLWRPTPLRRAYRLEKALDTPAHIYYKNESVTPSGSHKINTSVAQAYYNKKDGVTELTTETGAGQWGTALSIACAFLCMRCTVYMVRVSFEQKPYRRVLMETYGGVVKPSPSPDTEAGRAFLEMDPNTTGSLGMAISEAVEVAAKSGGRIKYSLGSVLNHVCMHQTIIGLETRKQLEKVGEEPDVIIGCCGGGSNYAGISFPFIPDKMKGRDIDFIGVEPTACPTLTRGLYAYDYGDTARMTPLLKQYTLGHNFVPPGIHAGGLRYHGVAQTVATLTKRGLMRAKAYHQNPVFRALQLFASTEGIVGAPESGHAVHCAIEEAIQCRESGEKKNIVFNLSGHGHFDMTAYQAYFNQELTDFDLEQDVIEKAGASIPKL
jgi:tryptophan synthase beta chain